MAKVIELSKGFVTIVSDDDYELVNFYSWHVAFGRSKKLPYARGKVDGKNLFLHRFLMGLKTGDRRQVDHLNDQTLDNRRHNLEVVSNLVNQQRKNGKIYVPSHLSK